jgi:molecular chaperone DnaJ
MIRKLLNAGGQMHKPLVRGFSKKEDYYKTLGISKAASQTDVKKAFAKLAREFHPDKNPAPEAKEKFSKITEAYSTLSDEKKRQVYDQYGMSSDEQRQYENAGFNPGQNGGFDFNDFFKGQQGGGGNPYESVFRDFEDIFGFEGGSKSTRPQRGADIIISIEIDFFESIHGVSKDVSYRIKDICHVCNGSKCKPGTSPTKCSTCAGKGTINYRQGPMQIQMACSSCKGVGTLIKNACNNCKGNGTAFVTLKEAITIPKGINSGQNLRVASKGNRGENGGVNGDLILKVTVRPDSYFRREGYDIYTEFSITIAQAVLGSKVEVRTLYGSRSLIVPSGTTHGSKIRLPGEGVSKLAPNHSQKGDHYVILNIYVPSKLSTSEKQIYEQLRSLETAGDKKVNPSAQQQQSENDAKTNPGSNS